MFIKKTIFAWALLYTTTTMCSLPVKLVVQKSKPVVCAQQKRLFSEQMVCVMMLGQFHIAGKLNDTTSYLNEQNQKRAFQHNIKLNTSKPQQYIHLSAAAMVTPIIVGAASLAIGSDIQLACIVAPIASTISSGFAISGLHVALEAKEYTDKMIAQQSTQAKN